MGSGTWSSATYSAVSGAKSRGGATFDSSARATGVHEKLDPKQLNAAGQNIRESRDSDEHPASTPIIVGFDETGSMGSIPRLVLTKLKTLFSLLVDKGYATDPQIAVAAYGDAANGERAPLQISQFESDNRIDDNLDLIYIEGLGGGNNGETSNLLLYYAATHVSTDAFDRRGRKGHLIIIGDERQVPLTPEMIRTYVGDEQPLLEDISFEGIARAVTEKWDVWILLINNAAARMQHSEAFYTDLFGPDHVLVVEDLDLDHPVHHGQDRQQVGDVLLAADPHVDDGALPVPARHLAARRHHGLEAHLGGLDQDRAEEPPPVGVRDPQSPLGIPVDESADDGRQGEDGHEVQRDDQGGDGDHPESARHSDGGCHPDRARRRQAPDAVVLEEDHPCADEADPRDHLRGDPRRVPAHIARERRRRAVQRHQGEQVAPQPHEDVGPDSRVLAVHFALQPDEAAEEQDEEGGHGLPGGWHVEQVHVGSLSQLHDDARRGEPTRRPPRTGCNGVQRIPGAVASRDCARPGSAAVRGAGVLQTGVRVVGEGRGAPQSGGRGPSGGAGSKGSRSPEGMVRRRGTIAVCASPASTT